MHFFSVASCLTCFQHWNFALPVDEREFESDVDEQCDKFLSNNVQVKRQMIVTAAERKLWTRSFKKYNPAAKKLINHIIIKVYLTRDSVTKVAYLMW